tara:strand:+ start:2202 stop:2516 length:315 start_codon:yes stop_codon:yes gene_type:complete
MEFDTDLACQLIKDQCASLYLAISGEQLAGVLMFNVSNSVRLGKILEIEGTSFLPGKAINQWPFVNAIAKQNDCQKIRAISSRALHKRFKKLKPLEAVFYAEVE